MLAKNFTFCLSLGKAWANKKQECCGLNNKKKEEIKGHVFTELNKLKKRKTPLFYLKLGWADKSFSKVWNLYELIQDVTLS